MRRLFRTSWAILKDIVAGFTQDKVLKLAAALAYITISSLPPLLLLMLTAVGWIYGNNQEVQQALFDQITALMGPGPAQQLQEFMARQAVQGDSTWATIIGAGTLVILATLVFVEIQDSINMIWEIEVKPQKAKNSIWLLIRTRLLSLGLIVAVGFLLLVSLLATTLIQLLADQIARLIPGLEEPLIQLMQFGLLFVLITLVFAMIFKVLPDARLAWRDVWGGAIFTAVLFLIGKWAIGFYLGTADLGSSYGAAGSLVVLLTWVYYSSVILYLGAEFTWARARNLGHKIAPAPYAVFVHKVPEEHTDIHAVKQRAEETKAEEARKAA